MKTYRLNEHGVPYECTPEEFYSLEGVKEFLEGRVVLQETIFEGTWLSTVFLGIDHGFVDCPEPILWETLAFGGRSDGFMERCSGDRSKALDMHNRVKKLLLEAREKDVDPVALSKNGGDE